jgi:SanA protein
LIVRYLTLVRVAVRLAVLFVLLVIAFSHAVVRHAAVGRIVEDPRELPGNSVVLLLGTSRYTRSGQENEFFRYRIEAVVDALDSGRVRGVVASGDNADPRYNEPRSMLNALTERGVSPERIVLDYAGFRTLDSVYRMQTVFGQNEFVIVSQRFHIERALFLAGHRGIDAVGFPARDASGLLNVHIRLREYLARVRVVLDVYLLNTEPVFAGDPVPIEFPATFGVHSRP